MISHTNAFTANDKETKKYFHKGGMYLSNEIT